jgi:hypothetical protein
LTLSITARRTPIWGKLCHVRWAFTVIHLGEA